MKRPTDVDIARAIADFESVSLDEQVSRMRLGQVIADWRDGCRCQCKACDELRELLARVAERAEKAVRPTTTEFGTMVRQMALEVLDEAL